MIGPIQLIMLEFDSNDRLRGEIMREIERLQGRGIIRLIDVLFVLKDEEGRVGAAAFDELTAADRSAFGHLLHEMMGLSEQAEAAMTETAGTLAAAAGAEFGMTPGDVAALADRLAPGTSAALLLFEHSWALGFKGALARAGGRLSAQGLLTRETLEVVSRELERTARAEKAVRLAHAIRGEAMLDALRMVADGETLTAAGANVKTAIAAETVQALVGAGVVAPTATAEALNVLAQAGLVDAAALVTAAEEAEAVEQELSSSRA